MVQKTLLVLYMAYFKSIYMFLWLYQWFNYLPESEVAVAILDLFSPTTGGGGGGCRTPPHAHTHTP